MTENLYIPVLSMMDTNMHRLVWLIFNIYSCMCIMKINSNELNFHFKIKIRPHLESNAAKF